MLRMCRRPGIQLAIKILFHAFSSEKAATRTCFGLSRRNRKYLKRFKRDHVVTSESVRLLTRLILIEPRYPSEVAFSEVRLALRE
jgi:hypothetical protein